jgi:uncharacterized Zn finger protein (UPF0148 family)
MNPGCGWCKKSDPVVERLVKDGHKIITLDITNADDAKQANEAKHKHNARCGTPLFLDAETGNQVCGMRGEEIIEKWAKGEDIPAPTPRPQNGPPSQGKPNNIQHDENATQKMMLDRYAARGGVWKEARSILVEEFYHSLSMWSDNLLDDTSSLSERPMFPTVDQIIEEAEKIHKFNRGFS